MDKKNIFAFILIGIVWYFSSQYLWNDKNEAQIQQQKQEEVKKNTSKPIVTQTVLEKDKIDSIVAESSIDLNDNIVVETKQFRISFSNLGAVVNKIELFDYVMPNRKDVVNLIPENRTAFNLNLMTTSGRKNLSETIFSYEITSQGNKPSVRFYLQNEDGIVLLEKKYTLQENYTVLFDFQANQFAEISGYDIEVDSGIPETEEHSQKNQNNKIVMQIDNDLKNFNASRLKPSKTKEGNIDWAAVRTKYFLLGVIPEQRVPVEKIKGLNIADNSPGMHLTIDYGTGYETLEDHYQLYLGPSIPATMETIGLGFENAAELGYSWIRWLSKIFILFLGFLHKFIPNYGVCIILFAIILKVILSPLTHKTYEASHKTQKMQPLIQEIQRKYKEDPRQMQMELGKLYKEHNHNPASGCLPMLLQMPIFFALYPAIRSSISLRQASFAFWLQDLSIPDPYYILPVFMGIFMFFQQKLMAPNQNIPKEQMDEKQQAAAQTQKMMLYTMPIFMSFIFSRLPAGLVLYWTFFNVLGLVQQIYVTKKFKKAN